MIEKFDEAGLNPDILKAIEKMGFVEPTPIQAQTLPFMLNEEQDLIAMAQTGTGKTAAFGLPLIQLTDSDNRFVQNLILCPTRELAMQITSDLEKFTKFMPEIKSLAVYGGTSIDTQIRALKRGVHFVVGTPGRTLDLIKRKVLKVENIKYLVLDEADEMLNMGFKDELDGILEGTPKDKRTFLFSATMPKGIAAIAKNYMSVSQKISVGSQNEGAKNVKHEYYQVSARDRFEVLKRIADVNPNIYCIVFCRTRAETKDVADKMMQSGYNADALHGDLSQAQRTFVMDRFRSKNLQILVATDVAARGLDVTNLSHIINYNLPDDLEVYIHRSGRTGRAGNKGISVAIIHSRENRKIRDLEKMATINFEKKPVPNGRQICEKQLFNLIDKIENVDVDESEIEDFLPSIYKKLEWLSREDLIKKMVSIEFNRFLTYYKNSRDLNIPDNSRSPRSERGERSRGERQGRDSSRGDRYGRDRDQSRSDRPARNSSRDERPERDNSRSERPRRESSRRSGPSGESNFTRFFINVGEKKGFDVPKLIGLINDTTNSKDIPLGKIDLMKKFSFFEVQNQFREDILSSFKNGDPSINVEESKPDVQENRNEYQGKRKPNYDRPGGFEKKKSSHRKGNSPRR